MRYTPLTEFGKDPSVFQAHIKKEHCAWNYVAYAYSIQKKDPTSLTGLESYVITEVQDKSIDWMPNLRTRKLNLSEESTDLSDLMERKLDAVIAGIQQLKARESEDLL